ncbi:hypothetical protein ACFSC4_26130 [Deinococcus malanensis]|uniref:hypothetical protein n=1 Tax=Deinococcus malanensis TaxID=1706855 RepID=UPI00166E36CD|nr:hypothetical protein [Deinococcus malanensis]
MAGLLQRVIATARILALDLEDQPLLDRLEALQNRADMESTEDIHQLLSELTFISEALRKDHSAGSGSWTASGTPAGQHVGCLTAAEPYI